MLEESRHFYVKGRRFDYLGDSDPIFSVTQAVSHKPGSDGSCSNCAMRFKGVKSVSYW